MAVNLNTSLLFRLYQQESSKKNQTGIISEQEFFKNPNYTVDGDKVTITESDGDTFTYDLSKVSRLTAAEAANRSNVVAVNEGDNVKEIMVTSTTRTKEEIQADLDEVKQQIKEVKEQIDDNNTEIKALREQVSSIYDEINDSVSDYIQKAEDIAEDKKEQVKELTQKEIEKYKNGEYSSKEELHNAIKAGVEGIMSEGAVNNLISELDSVMDSKQSEIEGKLSQISTLSTENSQLNEVLGKLQIEEVKLEQELKLALKKEEEAQKNCEPQGFSVENEDGSTTQYDFFVDRDGNGDLTDSSEFLGASRYEEGGQEGAWSEMTELDTNQDGVVDVNELEAGNVMVMQTTIDADGNKVQKAVSAKEAFGENSDLAISTTQNDTKSNADTPFNFNDSQYNNTLLGNFNVTLNGKDYTGYQTADSMEYLDDNYSFTSGSAAGAANTNSETALSSAAGEIENETFNYDTNRVLDLIKQTQDNDLVAFAEALCGQQGIRFNGVNDNNNNISNIDEAKELFELEKELELNFAA